jgi:hypothetical protein
MKHIILFALLSLGLAAPSCLMAQSEYNHAEVGVFADYFRLSATNPYSNLVGLGGRAAFNVSPHVAIEAEMNYDFARNYTTTFSNGGTTQFVTSRFRPLTGLFGPKFQAGSTGPFRAFITGKVGFINFSSSTQSPASSFPSAVSDVTTGNTHVAFYPGAGIEGFWGPIGLRFDAGDEIYLSNGARNNLKVEFGPTFRF